MRRLRLIPFVASFLLLWSHLAFATITHVQGVLGADGNSTSVTSLSVTFGAAVTSGDLVVGGISLGTDTTTFLTGCTDDKLNTYNIAYKTGSGGNGQMSALFWLNNITNGPITVTCNFSSVSFDRMVADEFSGINTGATPTDGIANTHSNAVSTFNSGNITTTVNGDLLYGLFTDDGGNTTLNYNISAPFTKLEQSTIGQTIGVTTGWDIQGTLGTIQSTFTTSSGTGGGVAGIIAFKASGASASVQPSLTLTGVGP